MNCLSRDIVFIGTTSGKRLFFLFMTPFPLVCPLVRIMFVNVYALIHY